MKKKKTYLLDTNVLMRYPNSIYGFDDNHVVVTAISIEELDKKKNVKGETGFQARQAIRKLDELREIALSTKKTLLKGVKINDRGGTFRLEPDNIDLANLPKGSDLKSPDNMIISCAKNIEAIVITEDANMRLKCDGAGVPVQSYRNAEIVKECEYTGRGEIYLSDNQFDELGKEKHVRVTGDETIVDLHGESSSTIYENEYFIAHKSSDPSHTILCRHSNGELKILVGLPQDCKVKPLNAGQCFAIDALMAPDIDLVILRGKAGSAKTFLSVVSFMQGFMHDQWNQIICTRNNVEMDSNSIGALPGGETDKIGPLMRGVMDNLRKYLKIQGTDEKDISMTIEDYIAREYIKFEALSFMRGRSISDSVILLDEAQNSSPHQVYSIVSRAGEAGKVILAGDELQIDDPSLDRKNNGLVFASESMLGDVGTAQLFFHDSEIKRSRLSSAASERMAKFFS